MFKLPSFNKPVVLLGEGARGADLSRLLTFGIPILTSWQASDLIDNGHPLYFGRPGYYGQRCANKVLYNADFILSLGCRLSLMTIGHGGLRKEQHLEMVDIDPAEFVRFPDAVHYHMEVGEYLAKVQKPEGEWSAWLRDCETWREDWPWFDGSHVSGEKLNAYEVVHRMQPYLRPNEIIVTDMGVALCAAFQVLKVKPPQRLMTSGGLGEMGCALPAAIGASFARGKGEVLCLHCDGGMMMNLQELQTIVHHRLPIKIIVFNNDGYLMLKSTQKNLDMKYSGVNAETGVSTPSFLKVAQAFGIAAAEMRTWGDFDLMMPWFWEAREPVLLEVFTDPEQEFSPKLNPWITVDGVKRRPTFEEMSP